MPLNNSNKPLITRIITSFYFGSTFLLLGIFLIIIGIIYTTTFFDYHTSALTIYVFASLIIGGALIGLGIVALIVTTIFSSLAQHESSRIEQHDSSRIEQPKIDILN